MEEIRLSKAIKYGQWEEYMIKRIVLFTKGIETLWYFSEQLGKTFKKLGYEIFYFDNCKEYDSLANLLDFCIPKITIVVTFNFDGCCGEEYFIDSKGINFFEAREIPILNIVVDHPFYYHKFLPFLPKDYRQISIDKEHEKYLEKYLPQIKRGPFMPLAGTCIWQGKKVPSWEEREYDIVFTGNYTPPEDFRHIIERHNDEYSNFYYGIIEDFKKNVHMCMTEGLEKHIMAEVEDATEENIGQAMPNMTMIDLYVRHYFRGLVVKTLVDSGLKVACYGAGWNRLECKHPENIINHKVTDSYGCLKAISNGKISLNVMPWFKDGAHDRVFNSMLNGAVCFSDWSKYMTEILEDEKDICFYELDNLEKLVEKIREILNNKEKWEYIVENGMKTASEKHTWSNRARQLHEYIKKNY